MSNDSFVTLFKMSIIVSAVILFIDLLTGSNLSNAIREQQQTGQKETSKEINCIVKNDSDGIHVLITQPAND